MKAIIKNISKTFLVLLIALNYSCEKDQIEIDNSPKVIVFNNTATTINVQQSVTSPIGQILSFIDASQNIISRRWSVDPDAVFGANVLVVNDPAALDVEIDADAGRDLESFLENVPNFIIPGTSTGEERLHLAYRTAGIYNVSLEIRLNESVSITTESGDIIDSVADGNEWVLTIPFTVEITE